MFRLLDYQDVSCIHVEQFLMLFYQDFLLKILITSDELALLGEGGLCLKLSYLHFSKLWTFERIKMIYKNPQKFDLKIRLYNQEKSFGKGVYELMKKTQSLVPYQELTKI